MEVCFWTCSLEEDRRGEYGDEVGAVDVGWGGGEVKEGMCCLCSYF